MRKVLALALEPSLWGTLPEELLHLVFARLSVAGIGQLRVLSKEWKWNIDCKDSDFNRVFDATTHLEMFALMSCFPYGKENFVSLYDMETDEWQVFEINAKYTQVVYTSIADGGLFCTPWQWENDEGHHQIVVVNPLTQKEMNLPPLLMGDGEPYVRVALAQLIMDRKTKEYKLYVVGYMKTRRNDLFAQVYDSHVNRWSLMESREGRIIGLDHYGDPLNYKCPTVYDCADRNLQRFNFSDIAPGLEVEANCVKLINDHLFVLHTEAPPGSTNLMQDGESIVEKCCISEFHLPEKATAWVKLGVHECDPSILYSPEDYELSLLACNGFLLVCSKVDKQYYDRAWLYNLSTCAWRSLPELELLPDDNLVLVEISWTAIP